MSRFRNPGAPEWISTNFSDTLLEEMQSAAEKEFAERRVAYCTLAPGTSPWASDLENTTATQHITAAAVGTVHGEAGAVGKRGREDDGDGDHDAMQDVAHAVASNSVGAATQEGQHDVGNGAHDGAKRGAAADAAHGDMGNGDMVSGQHSSNADTTNDTSMTEAGHGSNTTAAAHPGAAGEGSEEPAPVVKDEPHVGDCMLYVRVGVWWCGVVLVFMDVSLVSSPSRTCHPCTHTSVHTYSPHILSIPPQHTYTHTYTHRCMVTLTMTAVMSNSLK